jgi:hypothetical protein
MNLKLSNRPVRTRMPGGVAGVPPTGGPLCRSTTACLRGFLRVLADFGESHFCQQSAGFTLHLHILSPTHPTQHRPKSGRLTRHPYINQQVTRGRINRFFYGIGRLSEVVTV